MIGYVATWSTADLTSSTVLYCTVLYSTVQYCTVLYSTEQYCTGFHGIPWIPWNSMESMEVHGIHGFHGIPWVPSDPWGDPCTVLYSTVQYLDDLGAGPGSLSKADFLINFFKVGDLAA